jgi:hypothetical protein
MDSSVGIGEQVREVSGRSVAIACQELNEIPARHASYSKRGGCLKTEDRLV